MIQPINYKHAWLDEIPSTWKIDRLKDIVNINEKALSANTSEEYNIRYIDISNVNTNGIKCFDEIKSLTFKEAPSRARRIVNKGDTIISSVRTNLQAVAFIDFDSTQLIASTGFFVCTAKPTIRVNPKFIYWFLLTDYSKNYFFSRSVGVSYPAIDDYKFGSIPMPLPPSKEQKAIANYLDNACQIIDQTVQLKQQQLEKLEAYRKSVIHEAVTKGLDKNVLMKDSGVEWLGKIPEHWKVDRFRDVIVINQDALSANTDPHLEIQYIDISNVNTTGIVSFEEIRKLTFEESPSRARRVVKESDTIISSVRTNLQAVAFIDFESQNLIASTGFFVCHAKFTKKVFPKFLYWFLLTNYSKNYFFSCSVGVSYPAIDDYKFGSIPLPLPTAIEQKAIADYLDKVCTIIDETKETIEHQITKLTQYRKSLIHECVTGKKRIYQGD